MLSNMVDLRVAGRDCAWGGFVSSVVGMALWWPMLRRLYSGLALSGAEATQIAQFVLFLVELFFVSIVAFRPNAAIGVISNTKVLIAVVISGSMFIGLSMMSYRLGVLASPASIIGLVSCAAFVPLFMCMWIKILMGYDVRTAMWAICISFTLSFPLSFIALLQDPFRGVVFTMLPLASFGLWLVCVHPSRSGGKACGVVCLQKKREAVRIPVNLHSGITILLVVFVIVAAILRGLTTGADSPFAPEEYPVDILIRAIFSTLMGVCAFLGFGVYLSKKSILMLVLFPCFLLLACVGVLLFGMPSNASYVLNATAVVLQGLELILFLVAVMKAEGDFEKGVMSAGRAFVGPVVLAHIVSFTLIPLALSIFELERNLLLPMLVYLCATLLLLGMLAVVVVVLQGTLDVSSAEGAHGEQKESYWWADDCGLTDREKQVAELLARGYSYKKIAQTLYLSVSTVQSHVRSVYRKCGVNSRQEMIDLVQVSNRDGVSRGQ